MEVTVSYLRDSLGVHNFIYAFSPDNKKFKPKHNFRAYPGDEWVDMVGIDNYGDLAAWENIMLTPHKKIKDRFRLCIKNTVNSRRLRKPGWNHHQ